MGVSLQVYRIRIGSFEGLRTLKTGNKVKEDLSPPNCSLPFKILLIVCGTLLANQVIFQACHKKTDLFPSHFILYISISKTQGISL